MLMYTGTVNEIPTDLKSQGVHGFKIIYWFSAFRGIKITFYIWKLKIKNLRNQTIITIIAHVIAKYKVTDEHLYKIVH